MLFACFNPLHGARTEDPIHMGLQMNPHPPVCARAQHSPHQLLAPSKGLQPRTNFEPSAYIRTTKGGKHRFWLVSTAAVEATDGSVDLWRHAERIGPEDHVWTIERAHKVDPAILQGASPQRMLPARCGGRSLLLVT